MTASTPKTKPTPAESEPLWSSGRWLAFAGVLTVFGVIGLVAAIPIYASLTYRSAVSSLHGELATVAPDSVVLVDERFERCWNGIGPASVRTYAPADPEADSETGRSLRELARDVRIAIQGKGFEVHSGDLLSRERDDALDYDMVAIEVVDDQVRVVADVYDADSVFCLPG